MDVDCSAITYDTKPSPVILEAVNKTLEKIGETNVTEVTTVDLESTDSTEPLSVAPEAALSNSLLSSIDVNKTTPAELKEAYCRDVDSFSWEFGAPKQQQQQDQNQNYNQNQNYGNGNRGRTGAAVGTLGIVIILLFGLCCAVGVCFAFKKTKSKMFRRSSSTEPPVTFSEMHVNNAGMGGVIPNPGYRNEPTPQHSGYPVGPVYSDTGALYPGPAAIPPTQPGYSNFANDNSSPAPFSGQPAAYPPQPSAYPPQAAPYPPQAAPYPPQNAPYPPQNAPYPPQNAPYPPQNAPYPPAGALPYAAQPGGQPAYNPSAP